MSGRLELEWASSSPLKSQSIVWRGAWRSTVGQQKGPQAPEHVDSDRIDNHLNSTYVGLLQCPRIHICVPCVQASEYKRYLSIVSSV